jgi:predicted TIM-barrel fold metal-dependent hydrolase
MVRDYLFRVICRKARGHGVPFQLHTGHTSHVNPWPNVNPILLTPVLNEAEIAATAIVLVHGGYPFCAEAGYLTSVYPHVSCDLSLMIPWSSVGIARRVLETLEAAPTAKVMYGSDGIHLPEMNWLGALVGRRGIATALASLVATDVLTAGEAEEVAADILARNARRIYGLNERPPIVPRPAVPPASAPERAETTRR